MEILLVEACGTLRGYWRTVLEGVGYSVTCATSAGEARRILLTRSMDAVVLDLELGSEPGLSVATMATWRNPDCVVVVATGSTLFPRGELFLLDPAIVAVLRMPIRPQDLLATLQYHLRKAVGSLPSIAPRRKNIGGSAREEVGAAAVG